MWLHSYTVEPPIVDPLEYGDSMRHLSTKDTSLLEVLNISYSPYTIEPLYKGYLETILGKCSNDTKNIGKLFGTKNCPL